MIFSATHLAVAKALAMKLKGIQIKGYKLKDGGLEKTTSTPAPLRKGKRMKAEREAKAWRTKNKKSTRA